LTSLLTYQAEEAERKRKDEEDKKIKEENEKKIQAHREELERRKSEPKHQVDLHVYLVSATHLIAGDKDGKSDPYCIFAFANSKSTYKSKV
jgi:Ca2+-dependent lipid-binding protein